MEVIQHQADRDRVLAALGAGDVFGEMSVLTGNPAIASVVARRKSWVLALPRDDVGDLLKDAPQLRKAIAELAARRKADNRESLRSAAPVDGHLELI